MDVSNFPVCPPVGPMSCCPPVGWNPNAWKPIYKWQRFSKLDDGKPKKSLRMAKWVGKNHHFPPSIKKWLALECQVQIFTFFGGCLVGCLFSFCFFGKSYFLIRFSHGMFLAREKTWGCVRCLVMDTVQNANSGHPGSAISMAPVLCTLYSRASGLVLKFAVFQTLLS